ncbi:DUF4157 domain-containing protein [Aquimarina gracilis]|uniref:DUF4157 domain-containing protein n=1 Tax=Aquimarina gracilis TaxID=874422 RepID=A0ABU5ZTK5_9FLAO|nr:DUF4157 domain-containing protein [Aquimarina gracilis]MEB3345410.1 DUF4157 domain-containing protein [Aquimarina gracilis]
MKKSDSNTKTSGNTIVQKKQEPFFNKEGQNSFFSKSEASESFFNPNSVQTKLTVGQPNDKYEKEADATADSVVDQLNNSGTSSSNSETKNSSNVSNSGTAIQTKPSIVDDQEKLQKKDEEITEDPQGLQRKPIFESNTEPESELQAKVLPDVQKKGEDDSGSADLQSRLDNSKGGGSPLPSDTQESMGSAMGADFSNVRVHNDSDAAEMSNDLGAQAFTHGSDIYFNEGKYNTDTTAGNHLLAHELTHTMQQGASKPAVQKVEETPAANTEEVAPTRPTTPLDITHRLELTNEWASYLDYEYNNRRRGQRTFDLEVKIGERYRGTIKVNKKRSTAEGETAKYELAEGNHKYLNVSGWNFLDPMREAGVEPILVLNRFGDDQTTTGFLSVKMGGNPITGDVQGFIRGLNSKLEQMQFLGIDPINVDGLENKFENGRLVFQVSALSTVVDGYLEAGGGMGITGETFTFNLNANVSIAGLAEGEFTVARGEDGKLSGRGEIRGDIANVQVTVIAEYIEGVVTIQGTGRIESEKFSGEITFLVTDAARSRQMMNAALGVEAMDAQADAPPAQQQETPKTKNNQVLAGWGEVKATITPWLEGTAKVGIDNQGHVTIVGEIVVPDEIELMEQRGKKVQIFDVEIRAGYGIPLVGQVFLFAGIGMFVNAGFGPLVLKNVGFTGTYSTDPTVLQQFSITGTLGINAFAVLGLEAEAGVGVTLLGHDVKAGVNVTAAAGLRAYAEATPTFEYSESASPEGGKVGESRLKGHFEAAAQLFLQLSGALFYELDSPWWSPAPDGREEYPLGEVQYPIGDSMGIGADVDWLVGSSDAPELTFSPVEFDPDKFTADVMADPPPRRMGDADANPDGQWQDGQEGNQNQNPEVTGDGEGLPPSGRREENLRNLPDEQKYMRALDEMSRLENADPKPTEGVVEAKARRVKSKYGLDQIQLRDKQDDNVSIFVKHAREDNGRHLLRVPLMSEAERAQLLADAIRDLRSREANAAGEDGTIEESAAQSMLQAWHRAHPVVEGARVIDGGETWDYSIDIGDRDNTERGKRKKQDADADLQAGDGEIGKVARFDADGENHRIWIRVSGNQIDAMIASSPMMISERLNDWRSRLETLDNARKRVATGFLDSAAYLYEKLQNEAIKANEELSQATADPTAESTSEAVEADNAVEATQDRMISIFKNLFTIFGDTDNEDSMYLGFDRDIVAKTHLKASTMLLQEAKPIFEANKALRETNKNQGFTSWSGLVNKLKNDAPRTKQVVEKPITNSEEYGTYVKGQVERAANKVMDSSLSATEKQQMIDQKITEIEGGQARNAFASLRDQVFEREKEPISNQRLESVFKGEEGEHDQYKILESTVDYDGTTDGKLVVNYHYTVQIGDQPPEKKEFTVTIQQNQLASGARVTNHTIDGRNLAVKEPGTRGRTVSASNADSREAIQNAATGSSANRENVLNVPDPENRDQVMEEMRDQFKDQVDDTTIKFNASHLIADWFQGSGYSQALNLITTSEHYNKQIMFGAESEIKRLVANEETKYVTILKKAKYITFDINVAAEWMAISDSTVADTIAARTAEISGETPDQKRERLQQLHNALARDRDPKFCNSIVYNVGKIHLKDKDGNLVESKDVDIEVEIGQDTHLKEILKKQ